MSKNLGNCGSAEDCATRKKRGYVGIKLKNMNLVKM
jgi:hypothetical protein